MTIVQQGSINTTALSVPDLYVQIVAPQPQLNGVPTNILGIVGTATWGPVNSPTIASNPSTTAQQFGPMQARKFDLGTAVYTSSLQGASNYKLVRVTDGTDTAASASLNQASIVSDVVATPGTGYAPSDTITLTGGTASPFGMLTVTTTQLVSVAKNAGGTGYAVNDTITLAGGTFTQAAVVKVLTVSSGVIQTFSIVTPGIYSANSTTFTQASTSGSGTGATFNTGVFGVQAASVTTAGTYSVLPTNPVAQGSTSGSGTGATFTLSFACVTFTGKYTGSLGNSLTVTVGTGTNSTSGTPTFKLTVNLPGQLSEVYDNIGGTSNALYANMVSAINNGLSGLRGPSQLVVATLGTGTAAPTNPSTITLTGGTDGATTITSSVLIGQDTTPRKGMYALRGTGCSVALLADADDVTQWTLQVAYGLSEGTYMISTSPAGDTITNFGSTLATQGIDSYALKAVFGDWCYITDTVNGGITRLVSPQGFVAGKLANLSPEQSSLNKPLYGIIATQKTYQNQQYAGADLQAIAAARGEVIANPCPGGTYFGARLGLNSSSNAAINGDNYPRLTNYIAATLNAGMGGYIGQTQTTTVQQAAKSTLDNFLQNMFQQNMIQAWKVILDGTNNPQNRVSLGYMQADVMVQYLSIIKYFLINLNAGQTVVIASNSPTAAFQ